MKKLLQSCVLLMAALVLPVTTNGTNVQLADGVYYDGSTLFLSSHVTSLGSLPVFPTVIYSYALIPPACTSNTFYDYSATLHVPTPAMVNYFSAQYWYNFTNVLADAVEPESVTLNKSSIEIEVGKQFSLNASVAPSNATPNTVTWGSSDTSVATVTNDGAVTAIAPGECDIIAYCADKQAVCHVKVLIERVTINLDKHEARLLPNHLLTLTATCSPIPTDLIVSSNDNTVALPRIVNGSIQVLGLKKGIATITVGSVDGTANTDSCQVTVYTEGGDINSDGYVNISDAVLLIDYLIDSDSSAINVNNADTDRNGTVNISDVTTLIDYLLSGSWPWGPQISTRTTVFDATVDVGTGSSTAGEFTVVKDGITMHVQQGVANGTHYRFYKNYKVTFTSEIGAMTNIVFDCVGADNDQYGSGGFTSEPDKYEPKGKQGVWTNPGVNQVVFTATNFQVRATKVTVTTEGEVGLMAPSITPASGSYYESIQVSMDCLTLGAKIYYTTNDSTPTASSTQFTGAFTIPFELGKTVTVKAVAVKDGETSDVTTASYKFEDAPAFGWADMFNVADKTNVTFTYPSTVLWQSGQTLYCKDESGEKGYGIAYSSTGQVYQIGDIIPEGFGGQKTTYNTMPELQSLKGFQAATTYVEVKPDVINPAQVGEPYWAHYVLLQNVKVTVNGNGGTFTDANGNSCTFFVNTFGVPAPGDGGNHDVWGIVAAYKPNNGDLVFQILPISFDMGPKREPPTDVVSIKELYELNRGKWGHFTTPLTTIYQNGSYLYVKDNEDTYALVYGSVADTFTNGDYINDAIAAWTLFGDNKQITPNRQSFVKAGHEDPIAPEIMSIEEVMTDMVHWYLGFENVTITAVEAADTYTMTDETGTLKLIDKNFKVVPENLVGGLYYVEGFLSTHNGELEFIPILIRSMYHNNSM